MPKFISQWNQAKKSRKRTFSQSIVKKDGTRDYLDFFNQILLLLTKKIFKEL